MKKRWIHYEGKSWTLTDLAREHKLSVGTLTARLKRMPINLALHSEIASKQQSGRKGKKRSPWTLPLYSSSEIAHVPAAQDERFLAACDDVIFSTD